MLNNYGWNLVDVERAARFDEVAEYSDEIEDMIERTRANVNAIIYGRLYTYPVM
jgi:hypothetical protein